jgi:hypothetical protein
MPFGRWRGHSLDELPDDYLTWLAGLDDLREPLRSAVAAEHRRRCGAASSARLMSPEVVAVADELVTAGYRVLTRQRHPDHGGDHRAMVLVNQAAEWLRGSVRSLA